MKAITILLVMVLSASSCGSKLNPPEMIDKTTVQGVDLDRYLGKWYEIARYPNSFEKNLVGVTGC